MKAATYLESQIVVWDDANDYFALSATPTQGAKVVPYTYTIDNDGDMGELCEAGFFWAKADATMEANVKVLPSTTPGLVTPWVQGTYSTPPTQAEIQAAEQNIQKVFAVSREIVDGTTLYYLFEFIKGE